MSGRVRHRIRQFFAALRPRLSGEDRALAYAFLSPDEQRLFESMTLRDQQHGFEVMRRVQASRPDDAVLCTAALLHDCGKGGGVRVWHRVAHVLLGGRLASETEAGWRYQLWRLREHPRLGAELAERAGAEADVVRMIREQESKSPDERLAVLQAADEA